MQGQGRGSPSPRLSWHTRVALLRLSLDQGPALPQHLERTTDPTAGAGPESPWSLDRSVQGQA